MSKPSAPAASLGDAMQALSDAFRIRCRRCNSVNITERAMPSIEGLHLAIIAYTCNECGLDSAEKP